MFSFEPRIDSINYFKDSPKAWLAVCIEHNEVMLLFIVYFLWSLLVFHLQASVINCNLYSVYSMVLKKYNHNA